MIDKTEKFKLLSGLEESREALLELVGLAHYSIQWFSQDLEYLVTDNEEFYNAIFAFCRRSHTSKLQILLHDSKSLMSRGHRLINLAQKLSSRIEIRATNIDIVKQQPSAFLLVDNRHYYLKPVATQWQAKLQLDNPMESNNKQSLFIEAWDISPPDSQVRRLGI